MRAKKMFITVDRAMIGAAAFALANCGIPKEAMRGGQRIALDLLNDILEANPIDEQPTEES